MGKTKKNIVDSSSLPRYKIQLGDTTITVRGFVGFESKKPIGIQFIGIDPEGNMEYSISQTEKKSDVAQTNSGIDLSVDMPIVKVEVTADKDEYLGSEKAISLGSGKEFGKYDYYRTADGQLYARISGKKPRKQRLGSLTNRDSLIATVARTIAFKLDRTQFSRKELSRVAGERLDYGQKLKAVLDVLYLLGFLQRERKPTSTKRIKELFQATDALRKYVIPSVNPEQT